MCDDTMSQPVRRASSWHGDEQAQRLSQGLASSPQWNQSPGSRLLLPLPSLWPGNPGVFACFPNHCALLSLQLCQAKGFICEFCQNEDDIIFPFELNKCRTCEGERPAGTQRT